MGEGTCWAKMGAERKGKELFARVAGTGCKKTFKCGKRSWVPVKNETTWHQAPVDRGKKGPRATIQRTGNKEPRERVRPKVRPGKKHPRIKKPFRETFIPGKKEGGRREGEGMLGGIHCKRVLVSHRTSGWEDFYGTAVGPLESLLWGKEQHAHANGDHRVFNKKWGHDRKRTMCCEGKNGATSIAIVKVGGNVLGPSVFGVQDRKKKALVYGCSCWKLRGGQSGNLCKS